MAISLGDLNRDAIPDVVVLPAGTQLAVTLKSMHLKKGREKGTPYILASFEYDELIDGKEVGTIFHRIFLPDESKSVKIYNQSMRELVEFADKLGLDWEGFTEWIKQVETEEDVTAMEKYEPVGQSVFVLLGEDTYEGRTGNIITAFV